jgi:hypothetical protein
VTESRRRQGTLDALVDFLTMNGDSFWCVNADSNLVSRKTQDRDRNIVADHHGFTPASRQYEHVVLPFNEPGKASRCTQPEMRR